MYFGFCAICLISLILGIILVITNPLYGIFMILSSILALYALITGIVMIIAYDDEKPKTQIN